MMTLFTTVIYVECNFIAGLPTSVACIGRAWESIYKFMMSSQRNSKKAGLFFVETCMRVYLDDVR
jgi:hypothetical protein